MIALNKSNSQHPLATCVLLKCSQLASKLVHLDLQLQPCISPLLRSQSIAKC